MKLFIKIFLFVFVALVVNVNVTRATTILSVNIQKATTSFSFQNETPKTIYKVIENDLANCCQSEQYLVTYRERGIGVEVDAAKGGTTVYTSVSKGVTQYVGITNNLASIAVTANYGKTELRRSAHRKMRHEKWQV